MGHFNVIFHGVGITLPSDSAPEPIIGFYTTRRVRAASPEEAVAVARNLVLTDWTGTGKYASANRGSVPELSVEEVFPVPLMARMFGPRPGGYVFYPALNQIEEMTDMMSATRSFETNVEVLNRLKSMQQSLLRLGEI